MSPIGVPNFIYLTIKIYYKVKVSLVAQIDSSKPSILSCPFSLDFYMESFQKQPIFVYILTTSEGPRGLASYANFVAPIGSSRQVCTGVTVEIFNNLYMNF